MENDEILRMMENFECVWARVAAVPEDAETLPQGGAAVPSPPQPAYQPRWFCVF